jgi:hypothetical protein
MEQSNVNPLEFKAGLSIAHEVDPMLAMTVHAVNALTMPEQHVWLSLSGNVIYGHLISYDLGFGIFFNVPGDMEFEKTGSQEHLPTYAFLRNAVMIHPAGGRINVPVVRVKLAHVSAWGFGTPQ